MKNYLITIALLVGCCAFWSCSETTVGKAPTDNQGDSDRPSNPEPGKCYAKCLNTDGTMAWQEVLCGDKITTAVVREIQTKLVAAAYDIPISGVMNKEAKAALTKYHKDNNLPVGNLDIKTLDALGIKH